MQAIFVSTLLLGTISVILCSQSARFDNYQVFSVRVDTEADRQALSYIEGSISGGGDISLWNGVKLGRPSDVMVAPHKLADFEEIIQRLGLNRTLKVSNVQSLIDQEQAPSAFQSRAFDWTSYHTYDEIYAWLDQLLIAHSSVLSNIVIGRSYENRTIRAVKLSHKAGNPAIIIEANIHAREWITSATATWLLNELLTSRDADVVELAQNIDWYIVPVLNVDGFVYTHQKNRMWRKTRQPHSLFCVGADPNRNFDHYWRQYNGASSNPCSETYSGPHAESEPEIVAYTQFYNTIAKTVKLYISFHAYGQLIMTPYGNATVVPENFDDLLAVADKGKEAIAARNGREYTVGSITEVITIAPGSSIDWALGREGLALAFAFEFRDMTNGPYGFILPADQIIPNAVEIYDGIKAMVRESRSLKYF